MRSRSIARDSSQRDIIHSVYGKFDRLDYSVPLTTRLHPIAGLSPNADFTVRMTRTATSLHVGDHPRRPAAQRRRRRAHFPSPERAKRRDLAASYTVA
jgi:hypothetical protein